MSNKQPLVSVISCHHVGNLIDGFVESLAKQTFQDYELIVMSDCYSPTTTLGGKLHIIPSSDMPAKKRNIGAKYAHGQYLAFFDDDVEIASDCLEQLLEQASTSKFDSFTIGMSYGKLHKADEPNRFDEAGGFLTSTGFIWSRAGQNIVDEGQYDNPGPIFSGKSASCMLRKDIFEEVGGFDESFGILGEESDLAWRIWLRGYEVWFNPKARGIHYFNTKWKPAKDYYTNSRVFFNGPKNYICMLYKNLGTRNLIRILPVHISCWILTAIMFILTGKCNCGILILRGIFQNVKDFKELHSKRKVIQSKRIIKDKELFAVISRNPGFSYFFKRFFKYRTTGLHG